MQKCKVERKKAHMEGDVIALFIYLFFFHHYKLDKGKIIFKTLRNKADNIDVGRGIHL